MSSNKHFGGLNISPNLASQPFCALVTSRYTQFFGFWRRVCGLIARNCFFMWWLKYMCVIKHLNTWVGEKWMNFWIMCPIACLFISINELCPQPKVWYVQTPDMTVLVSATYFSFSQKFTRKLIVGHTNDFWTNFPYKIWLEHIY